jgi:hypothetical protein
MGTGFYTTGPILYYVSCLRSKFVCFSLYRNIKIQWLSNEPHIIPAKDNPTGEIYAPDFYDKTGNLSGTKVGFIIVFLRLTVDRKAFGRF